MRVQSLAPGLVLLAALVSACAPGQQAPTPHAPATPSPTRGTGSVHATSVPSRAAEPRATSTVVSSLPESPLGLPSATGAPARAFESSTSPYQVEIPEGWVVRSNAVESGSVRADFFIPARGPGNVSINVVSEPLRGSHLTSERYRDDAASQVGNALGAKVTESGEVRVGQIRGYTIEWRDESQPLRTVEVTQVVWVAEGRGWVATLRTPPGERERYLPTLEGMLRSWRVR